MVTDLSTDLPHVRLQVLQLLSEYSWGYDSNDMQLLGGVFSEQARTGGVVANTDIGWGPWVGKDNIVRELSKIRCSQTDKRRHVINSVYFESVSPHSATLNVYLALFSSADKQPPHLITTGQYTLIASMSEGRWFIDVLDEVLESPF